MRWMSLVVVLLVCGCMSDPGFAPQAKPDNPVSPVAQNEQLACYYESLATGLDKGWFASPNEFVARAKVTREKLGLAAGGDAVDSIEVLKGASVNPFTEEQKKSLSESMRDLAKKARG